MSERLISLRVQGFRCIDDMTVRLDGLQLFIGENGTGKSTLVEAFEILRLLAQPGRFTYDFQTRHGDIRELVRSAEQPLRLTIVIASDEREIEYSVELKSDPNSSIALIAAEQIERLINGERAFPVLLREHASGSYRGPNDGPTRGQQLATDPSFSTLHAFGLQGGPPEIGIIRRVLQSLEVFPPIDVGPLWAQPHELGAIRTIRTPSQVAPANRLTRDGANLASAFLAINGRGPEVYRAMLQDVRAGLGMDITHVAAVPSSPSLLQLTVRFGARDVAASQLSQGELSYLALVAVKHLGGTSGAVVFDEPELHLHPSLLARAAWLLADIAESRPVVVSTHADAFLDALEAPAQHVRVLTLDAQRRATVMRVDADQLEKWRKNYATLSELRRSGLLDEVLVEVAS
ncbi:MAG: AAA family ATPase [Myxococcales bacterium]|nr:AAA family ATPase [Myxococcales bacterium]